MKTLVRCETRKGLFSNEVIATVRTVDGARLLQTDRSNLKGNDRVVATVIEDLGDRKRVMFPNVLLDSGRSWAVLASTELEELGALG